MQNGDKVVYSKFAGTELKVSDDEFVILKVRAGLQLELCFICHACQMLMYLLKLLLVLKEEDVIGVLNSRNIADLLPIGDRILIQVRPQASLCAV